MDAKSIREQIGGCSSSEELETVARDIYEELKANEEMNKAAGSEVAELMVVFTECIEDKKELIVS